MVKRQQDLKDSQTHNRYCIDSRLYRKAMGKVDSDILFVFIVSNRFLCHTRSNLTIIRRDYVKITTQNTLVSV